jgi:hypothetical protein
MRIGTWLNLTGLPPRRKARSHADPVLCVAMNLVILLMVLSAAQAPASVATAVVVSGRPETRTDSASDAARHTAVTGAERDTLKVVIVRKGDRYFWASRDNRELERRVSGAFHIFVERTDGGYVRVFDRSTLAESMRPEGARFEYTEHVPQFRGAVTYWGTLDEFQE